MDEMETRVTISEWQLANHCFVRDAAAGLTFCTKLVVWLCRDADYSWFTAASGYAQQLRQRSFDGPFSPGRIL